MTAERYDVRTRMRIEIYPNGGVNVFQHSDEKGLQRLLHADAEEWWQAMKSLQDMPRNSVGEMWMAAVGFIRELRKNMYSDINGFTEYHYE
jgi:hypothetical protein